MVEIDARLAVGAPLVAKSVLDLDLVAGSGASEVVVAHRDRGAAHQRDLVILIHAVRPSLAAVDGEAGVLSFEKPSRKKVSAQRLARAGRSASQKSIRRAYTGIIRSMYGTEPQA